MKVSSFDIFDTCLIRKCGTPELLADVLSLRAFKGKVDEMVRQEFVAARLMTERSIHQASTTLEDIWRTFSWEHPMLKSKHELLHLELETEHEMLMPVLSVLNKVNACRKKGHRILFVSDMYLSSEFIKEVLVLHGFFQQGDGLYVSCECNAEKRDGSLFELIKRKESLNYRQ